MPKQRIGIFAGTFNPVHIGHLAFAEQALIGCKLDKVYFLVEPRPRHKQAVKAALHRERMVVLAIKDHSHFGSIHLPDNRFTVQNTLPHLKKRLSGAHLSLLMGDDVVRHLAAWPHVDELYEAVDFIIGARAETRERLEGSLKALQEVRADKLHYQIVEIPPAALVSSTHIRQQLKRGEMPDALPEGVQHYISKHKMYTGEA